MKVALRLNGKVIGIDPSTGPYFPVYADRDQVGAWEEGELTAQPGIAFDFRFLAANRQLTITPDGRLESRSRGAIGLWELLYATDQPDGSAFVYRVVSPGHVPLTLTIEARA
jgi:hypothetical protein